MDTAISTEVNEETATGTKLREKKPPPIFITGIQSM